MSIITFGVGDSDLRPILGIDLDVLVKNCPSIRGLRMAIKAKIKRIKADKVEEDFAV